MSTVPVRQVAGHRVTPAVVRSVPLPDPGPLLGLLPAESGLSWVHGDEGLVGWGVAAAVEVGGPDRFARAESWWRSVCAGYDVADEVGQPGTGPVAFGSFAFDDWPGTSVLVVPRVIVGRRAGRAWLTMVGGPEPALARRPAPGPRPRPRVRWSEGSQPPTAWRAAVAEAVRRIEGGELAKVVLARDLVADVETAVDVPLLLRRLADRYAGCWVFSCAGLVGATPELLVRRVGDTVASRVLAGTARRTGGRDDALAAELLGSAKDRNEHALAVASVLDALTPHCADLVAASQPQVLSLANVLHLATDVRGRLRDASSALSLAAALHPTAAVCGTPTDRARQVIRDLEGMDRGRYAGPVGWLDARGDGEWGIALRCAEVDGRRLRLFAGCGIVAGSDPDAELAEAQAKFLPVRDALEGC